MSKKVIVTHNASFHTDDVFAVATICIMLGEDFEIEIVRSRDSKDWERGDYVIDVGGAYDPSRQRFDHHQEGGAGTREDGIDYSSMGLVWKEYGEIVSGSKEVADIIDNYFVRPVDAHDNGQAICTPNYKNLEVYSINSVIREFHPGVGESGGDYDKSFLKAVDFAKMLLERMIVHARGEIEGRKKIRDSLKGKENEKVVEIDHNYPWEEVLVNEFPNVLYVVYPDSDERWRLKCVKKAMGSFENRKPLPATWGGKVGAELIETSGVADATFCHRKLFTAGAKSREGVLKMAGIAVNN